MRSVIPECCWGVHILSFQAFDECAFANSYLVGGFWSELRAFALGLAWSCNVGCVDWPLNSGALIDCCVPRGRCLRQNTACFGLICTLIGCSGSRDRGSWHCNGSFRSRDRCLRRGPCVM